jgi:nanoRNase/pAp phosphatase (c-di-AMP/oligoRNAs hydrolase)
MVVRQNRFPDPVPSEARISPVPWPGLPLGCPAFPEGQALTIGSGIRDMAIEGLKEKFAEFSDKLAGVKSVCLLCHDNPDPDSIAGMMALRTLLYKKFRIRARMLYGGVIGRAENRAMVRLLKVPLIPIERARLRRNTWFALVDTQPASKNHSLPEGSRVLIVFDHHPEKRPLKSEFCHIGEGLGATCTLIYGYLREAGLEVDPRLATALAYAIISETQDLGRESSREDIQAYLNVLPRARLRVLADIKNPPLSQYYFQTLSKALNSTFSYRNIMITRLGLVPSSDMIHQMADLFLRLERRNWSLCIGWTPDYILLSLRSNNLRARCGKMIQRLMRGRGAGGGHDMMAGGRIPCSRMSDEEKIKVEEQIIARFIRQFERGKNLQVLVPIIRDEQHPDNSNARFPK